MATKVAFRHPEEQLLDHAWTKKWTLPSDARSPLPRIQVRSNRAAMRGSSKEGTDDLQVHSCEWVRGYLLV